MSLIIDHCECVFPVFSFTPFAVGGAYWLHFRPMVKPSVYVLFKAPNQFPSNLLSCGYLFSSATVTSATNGCISGCFARFRLFVQFASMRYSRFGGSSQGLFAQTYLFRCWLRAAQQALILGTALFGLHIDNLDKLAFALP